MNYKTALLLITILIIWIIINIISFDNGYLKAKQKYEDRANPIHCTNGDSSDQRMYIDNSDRKIVFIPDFICKNTITGKIFNIYDIESIKYSLVRGGQLQLI